MRNQWFGRGVATAAVAVSVVAATTAAMARQAPSLTVISGRVEVAGTSNIHSYTASTTAIRVLRGGLTIDVAHPAFVEELTKPGALNEFEIAVPAASLSSGKDGLDKNMHKALKVQQHPDITFRLSGLQAGTAGALEATGILGVAGVEREVAFDVDVQRNGSAVNVKGVVPMVMTDYGITPPKAMLGMLKTDPKVTVTFEASFTVPPPHLAGNTNEER